MYDKMEMVYILVFGFVRVIFECVILKSGRYVIFFIIFEFEKKGKFVLCMYFSFFFDFK